MAAAAAPRDPEKFRWVPRGAAEPLLPPPDPAHTLFVFDFDCTLSSLHLFKVLRSYQGQQDLVRDPNAFFDRIFGGTERIAALQQFLRALRERSCTLRVLSFGNESEIIAALQHIGVDTLFDGVYGNASYEPRGVTSIRDCKQQMITLFQQELGCANVVFTDDDRGNFPQSGDDDPSISAVQHIFPAVRHISAKFCVGVAGLEPSDMDELLALVSPRGGDGAGAGAAGAPSAGAHSTKE